LGYDEGMKYFFILGTNAALSVAELAAVLPIKKAEILAPDFLLWETETEIKAAALSQRLGGVIKIGRIIDKAPRPAKGAKDGLLPRLIKLAADRREGSGGGKFNFGLSAYGAEKIPAFAYGRELKKYFSARKISARFVTSREKTLSSVVVTQNKLVGRGLEMVLAAAGRGILIGETLAVQPFKDLSRRDYGRPARDDLSGLLPPKLAQIMINLARVDSPAGLIVDPFCGSGTILTEALLMGYKNLAGSDVSAKAAADSRKNIGWIKELYGLENFSLKLSVKNALDLDKFMKAESAAALITEPYLGPQRGPLDFKAAAEELAELYGRALAAFSRVLKPDGRIVMIWPVFYGDKFIFPALNGFKIVNPLPENLRNDPRLKTTGRDTIVYGRPGQKVHREVVVLEKIVGHDD